ncbi:hypothetical protein PCANC_20589 [Puccinia coronata f. sp. avenae]|uniref:Uncharacterized protein n=1 Tax=Puccinia coronata f. sp. avenae TaxID=200324 RepID=A0A2N5SE82_9BASI|nr:hypothetical protein PCANC_20589 [Puccinia coronata f. sp. avenae]
MLCPSSYINLWLGYWKTLPSSNKVNPPATLAWSPRLRAALNLLQASNFQATDLTAGDDKALVELETGAQVIVNAEAMDELERVKQEDDYVAV